MFSWPFAFPDLMLLAEAPAAPAEDWLREPVASPPGAPPSGPVPEEAFPTAAALDALHAELSAPPPDPDLALRQGVVALLGLDAAVAEDPALYQATLAALPPPGPEPDPLPELSPEPFPAWDWAAMSRDWGDPSRGWILG